SKRAIEALIRSLQQASGDVVVVATVPTFKPYGDIREYAVKMFENHGRGVGQRGKDNGVLILLAVNDRQVRVEVTTTSNSSSPMALPGKRAVSTWPRSSGAVPTVPACSPVFRASSSASRRAATSRCKAL